jgi:hypothetical protein
MPESAIGFTAGRYGDNICDWAKTLEESPGCGTPLPHVR